VAFQKYLTEQNNLKAVQVVANQTVVQARSNVAKAEGESQSIRIITEQLRQSPQYLQWQSINRWNGQMPKQGLVFRYKKVLKLMVGEYRLRITWMQKEPHYTLVCQ
jgi:hypothetical protein